MYTKSYQRELELLEVDPNENPAVGVKTTVETRNGKLPAVYKRHKETNELVKVVTPAYAEEYYESVKPEVGLHNSLDIAGTVFDPADTINGIVYALEGDKANAALSFAAQIPVVGIAATGSKLLRTGLKYGDEAVQAVEVVVKSTDEIIDAAQTVTSKSDEAVKTTKYLVGEGTGNDVLFGQKGVSQFFSKKGKFKGASIADVAEQLKAGTLSPDDLPIEYIVRDGQKITLNNRSLTALSQAGLKPTVLIDKTGNAFLEKQLTERLLEMGGSPSSSMFIRTIKETVDLP